MFKAKAADRQQLETFLSKRQIENEAEVRSRIEVITASLANSCVLFQNFLSFLQEYDRSRPERVAKEVQRLIDERMVKVGQ